MKRVPSSPATRATALFAALAFSGLRIYGQTPYIGVNFEGANFGGAPTAITDPAGLVPQSNWNNISGNNTTGTVLMDAAGNQTPVTISFGVPEAWGSGVGTSTGNHQLFNGYIGTLDNGTGTISLSNLPIGFYDLIAYTLRDNNGAGAAYSTNASSVVYHVNTEGRDFYNADPAFRQADSTDPNARELGNYVRWNSLPVAGSLSLSMASEPARGPVNGFQVVVSTAASKAWSGSVSGNWDTASANFSGAVFQQGDLVTFGDLNGSGGPVTTRTITIQPGGVAPGGMIINNSTGDYSFDGAITGTSIAKAGTGTASLLGNTDNTGLRITVDGGTLVLSKDSSSNVHAIHTIAGIAAGATVRLAGTGGDQISDATGAGITALNGTLDLNGRNEAFGTLSGSGLVLNSATGTQSTLTIGTGNSAGNFTGAIQNGNGTVSLVKTGTGRQVLGGANTYTGTTIINDGVLELSGSGQIFNNPAGIVINGSGGRTPYIYNGNQAQTRLGALVLTDLSVDPLGSTPVTMNGGELVHYGSGNRRTGLPGDGVREYTVQNVTAASGMNTFSNQPYQGATPLTLGNLTRSIGATVEFKRNHGTLGVDGDNGQIKIVKYNGADFVSDPSTIIGGWAVAYNGDGGPWDTYWASYGDYGVKAYDGVYVSSVSGASPADNVRVESGGADFVTVDTTVNSLVVRGDNALTIDAAATVKVNSGGVIITYGGSNQISGPGKITTGMSTGELFLHSYDESYGTSEGAVARFNLNASIVDNGTTPTMVVKSGNGPLRLGGENSYTGGTKINAGTLQIRTSSALGTGPVSLMPGTVLQFGPSGLTVPNNITLVRNSTLVGGVDAGFVSNTLTGTLTLNEGANVTTWWSDKELTLAGKVTGSGGLQVTQYLTNAGGRVILTNPANDYLGDTVILAGTHNERPTLRAGAENVIPNGAGKGNLIVDGRFELNGFSQSVNGLSGSGAVNSGDTTATLTVGNTNVSSTFSGTLSGGNGSELQIAKTGTGTLTLAGTADNASVRANVQQGTLILNKASTSGVHAVAGISGVSSGTTLQLAGTGNDQIYDGSGWGVENMNGTFDLNGRSEGFDAFSGNGLVTNSAANTTSVITVGTGNGSSTFAGVIQDGSGKTGFAKTGTGIQTLSGANTYSGTTAVLGGTLTLSNPASTNNLVNSSAVAVASGATLNVTGLNNGRITLSPQILSGAGTVQGSVSTVAGSTISPGDSSNIGTLTITGDLSLTGGTALNFVLGRAGVSTTNVGAGSVISVGGNLSLSNGLVFNPINNGGANGQGSLSNGYYRLMTYGTLSGFDAVNTFISPQTGTYTFTNDSQGKAIYVQVSGLQTLEWTGAADGVWDTTTNNWTLGATAALYQEGADVKFVDTKPGGGAVTNTQVTINAGGVRPGGVFFTNSAINYTLNSSDAAGIAGTAGVSKSGTGTVTFTGANSFTGAIDITGGSIDLSHSAALGDSVGVSVASGGALQLNGGISTTSAVPLTLNGTGRTGTPTGALNNISGDNTYTGAVTLASNSTIGATAGNLNLTAGVNNNGNALTVAGAGNVNLNGVLSGTGALTKEGTGTLTLATANTYAGGTEIKAGLLKIGNGQALGASGSVITISPGAAFDFNGQTTTDRGYTAIISGSGTGDPNTGVLFSSTGANPSASFDQITFAGNATIGSNGGRFDIGRNSTGSINLGNGHVLTKVGSSFTAILNQTYGLSEIVINGGILLAENDFAFGTYDTPTEMGKPTPVTVNAGGVASAWGGRSLNNPYTLNGGGLRQVDGFTDFYSGTITVNAPSSIEVQGANSRINLIGNLVGTKDLTKVGTGTLSLANENAGYSGSVIIDGGTVETGTAKALGSGAVAVNAGGTLDLLGVSQTIQTLSGAGTVRLNGATLTTGSDNASAFAGAITGDGSVVKAGTGTLTLSGTGTYTGPTEITSGTLKLGDVVPSQAGVFEGVIANGSNAFDTTAPIPKTTVQWTTQHANSTSNASWPDNTTWGYIGAIDNPTDRNIVFTFAENFDDNVRLIIDGVEILNNNSWNTQTEGSIVLSPGPHTFELRLGQGAGGVGPANGGVGATTGLGIAYSNDGGVNWLQLDGGVLTTGTDISSSVSQVSSVVMSSNTTFDLSGNTATIGSLANAAATATGQQVLLGAGTLITGKDDTDTTFSGVISGSGRLIKVGSGRQALTGDSTYTGRTIVSAGTLLVQGSLSGTTAVGIGGGELVLGASDRINDLATLTLSGEGTLDTAGFDEVFASFFLDGLGTFDLGLGDSVLKFANSSANTWTGRLLITNWSGSITGAGTDQLFFGTSAAGLTAEQIAMIQFENPAGYNPGIYGAQILPTGELVVIPEPTSVASILGGIGMLLGAARFRRRNWRA